jgi:hypothetical protein
MKIDAMLDRLGPNQRQARNAHRRPSNNLPHHTAGPSHSTLRCHRERRSSASPDGCVKMRTTRKRFIARDRFTGPHSKPSAFQVSPHRRRSCAFGKATAASCDPKGQRATQQKQQSSPPWFFS